MASRTVNDSTVLERRRLELWQERAKLLRHLRAVEKEITDLEMGVVHEQHDRDAMPSFALKGDSAVHRHDNEWIPDFLRKEGGL